MGIANTGGLQPLLEQLDRIPVYGHPDLFLPHHSSNGGQLRAIGIPWSREQLAALGADFRLDRAAQKITPEITLSGEIPRVCDFETAVIRTWSSSLKPGQGSPISWPMTCRSSSTAKKA
ncbi:MAG: hypothetical protein GXP51_03080 [Deltaproteobacteria bacterium]|nr:hypothetical protein [Deltaproteobacteria bacterium]